MMYEPTANRTSSQEHVVAQQVHLPTLLAGLGFAIAPVLRRGNGGRSRASLAACRHSQGSTAVGNQSIGCGRLVRQRRVGGSSCPRAACYVSDPWRESAVVGQTAWIEAARTTAQYRSSRPALSVRASRDCSNPAEGDPVGAERDTRVEREMRVERDATEVASEPGSRAPSISSGAHRPSVASASRLLSRVIRLDGSGAEGIRTPDLCRARARVGFRIRGGP